MISVQNHQRLLSGSRLLVYCLFCCTFLMACGSTNEIKNRSKTANTKATRPLSEITKKNNKAKIDTVQWDIVDENTSPPITKSDDTPISQKEEYNVTLFIPFSANDFKTRKVLESRNGERFSNYYSGIMMALEESTDRISSTFNINVVDSKDQDIQSKLRTSNSKEADIIIGPYDRDQLKEVIRFGKENDIVVVSPWQSLRSDNINPNYVQLRPNLKDYYAKMLSASLKRNDPKDIMFLTREGDKRDKKRLNSLQKMIKELELLPPGESLAELELNVDSLSMGESAYDSIFYDMNKSVFVIPNWSSKDESFVYNALRRLSVERGLNNVEVYGMPIMLDSERIDFDFFKTLNLHTVRWKFVDTKSYAVKSFRKKFLEKYQSIPTNDALDGYDMMNYLVTHIDRYGKYFQHQPMISQEYLQTDFNIVQEGDDTIEFSDNSDQSGRYFVNKHLDVVRFNGRSFERIR